MMKLVLTGLRPSQFQSNVQQVFTQTERSSTVMFVVFQRLLLSLLIFLSFIFCLKLKDVVVWLGRSGWIDG